MEVFLEIINSQIVQALLIASIIGITARLFSPKGKLIWGVSHQHYYNMPKIEGDGTFPVVTQQIWFQNLGRLPIEEIEVVINWKPQHYEIWFPREWQPSETPDKRFLLKVPSLSARELFTLSMIDTRPELPEILNVRWKGGIGRRVLMSPQRIYPMWINYLILMTLFFGLFSIFFFLLRAIIHLNS